MSPLIILLIIVVTLIFLLPIILLFTTKSKSRMMSNMMKANKDMIGNSKEDLTSILSDLGSIQAKAQKNILDKNEDTLRYNANKSADINKAAVETTARAIKKGLIKTAAIKSMQIQNSAKNVAKNNKKIIQQWIIFME